MKYVRIDPLQGLYGYLHDPQPYLDALPRFIAQLPPGARSYASAPGHYDFSSHECVKDLTFGHFSLKDTDGQMSLEVYFEPNEWKHERGLLISYPDVQTIRIETRDKDQSAKRLGSVQLDEVLPREFGLIHEFAFTGGTMIICATDLYAAWTDITLR
ncbi:hypothetical protein SAMN05421505_1647 [Sinosporangium album]|uniref:Immunity protein 50 n=1 Tax=Sinosporangium album TaxID=504805 RepID=A0A1G8LC11_9ACTN|nr:hypothetical protein SAMN05421505_1647 [Sinosporangium album]